MLLTPLNSKDTLHSTLLESTLLFNVQRLRDKAYSNTDKLADTKDKMFTRPPMNERYTRTEEILFHVGMQCELAF